MYFKIPFFIKIIVTTTFLLSFAISSVKAQFSNKEIKGQILIEKNSEFYTFRAAVINQTPTAINLRYEFSFFVTDSITSNTTKSSKENYFLLDSYEKKILTSLTVNYTFTNKVVLLLVIYDKDNKPLGSDRIELSEGGKTIIDVIEPLDNHSDDLAPSQDGVILEGIVSQKTLTKSGRDFFREFYQLYYNAQIRTSKNIFIKEVPGRRRNTLVTVEVENNLVWQFFAQPRKDYLKNMAQITMSRVNAYLRRSENRDDTIIQY